MGKKKPGSKGSVEVVGKQLPIEWHYPENQLAILANQLLVQFDGHDFHLSFFELKPPVVSGSDEEKEKALQMLESVRANCVARIVINKDRMPAFLQAMAENFAKQVTLQSLAKEEPKNDDG